MFYADRFGSCEMLALETAADLDDAGDDDLCEGVDAHPKLRTRVPFPISLPDPETFEPQSSASE
jgi:hypothetical protein